MDIQRKKRTIQEVPRVLPERMQTPVSGEEAFFFFAEEEKRQISEVTQEAKSVFSEEILLQRDLEPFREPFREVEKPKTSLPLQKKIRWLHIPKTFLFRREKLLSLLFRFGVFLFCLIGVLGVYFFLMRGSIEQDARQGAKFSAAGLEALKANKFTEAKTLFEKSHAEFLSAKRKTLYISPSLAAPFTHIPGVAKGATGIILLDAGLHLTDAAEEGTTVVEAVVTTHEASGDTKAVSFLSLLEKTAPALKNIERSLTRVNDSLQDANVDVLSAEEGLAVTALQEGVPAALLGLRTFFETESVFDELLGKYGPRTYLFLFQNNQELRPTGGFIGTYGILEFKDGRARRFFIDGIFNPDGQLKENIVPPKPIQKISAGWSLHDSNWSPHFPTSAEKAIFFYEKTGGPTVDGVFTLTPAVLERLLALTGPIELPEYDLVVDENNFIPTIQTQVEVNYDKTENKPKKIIGDLASILMERVFSSTDPVMLYRMASIFVDGLNEKQILLYTRNTVAEEKIVAAGWSGSQVDAPHDYLSIIHMNINGFKTDGVIEDYVKHTAAIQEDGSIIATVTVTRKHTGGNTPYEWWNKVNSDYMRVYVPLGSELIAAEGHTREFPNEPLNYKALGFKQDKDVLTEEEKIVIDEETGTRVGVEQGKTVFGNWVYVSPGESVSVTYTYLLPFKVSPSESSNNGYSLLFQKQSGVKETNIESSVSYPEGWQSIWQTSSFLVPFGGHAKGIKETARGDVFYGIVFGK